jgi:type II secretory pathway component PulJ
MGDVMPDVNAAVATLEKRLRRAQIQRIVLLWFTVVLFALVGLLMVQNKNQLVAGCERSHARDREIARLQLHAGALEDRQAALRRAAADCGELFHIFP